MIGVLVIAAFGALLTAICVVLYIGARLGLPTAWAVPVTILIWLMWAALLDVLVNSWLVP